MPSFFRNPSKCVLERAKRFHRAAIPIGLTYHKVAAILITMKNTMKTVIIHIGMVKTGTSSIQTVLFKNRQQMAADGHLYPTTGLREEDHGTGHFDISPIGAHNITDCLAIEFNKLINEIDRDEAQTIILSSEFWSFALPGYIADLAHLLAKYDVKVIFYVREQKALIESTFLQWQKKGFEYLGNIEKFYQVHADSFNLLARVVPWADAFGDDRMICRLYDPAFMGDNVVSDFMAAVGLSLPSDALRASENPSLPACFSALLALMDASGLSPEVRKKAVDHMLGISRSIPKEQRGRLLSREMELMIESRYRDSNQELARRFLQEPARIAFLRSTRSTPDQSIY